MIELLKRKFNKGEKTKYLAGLLLSLVSSFMICFYAPLELFSNNLNEFLFDASLLVPVVLKTFVIAWLISSVTMMLVYIISEKAYFATLVVYFVAFLSSYVQGNYMTSKLPVLDGTPVNWNGFVGENIKTAVLWLVVVGIVIFVIRKFKKKGFYAFASVISGFICAILAVSLFIVFFTKGADKKSDNNLFIDSSNMMEMSTDKNFVIFVLDCLDARAMNILMDKDPDKYEGVFEDFTYYTNTMSMYPYTNESIPYILTGEGYINNEDYVDYSIRAYNNSPLFQLLEERGFTIDLYENDLPPIEGTGRFDSIFVTDNDTTDYGMLTNLELRTSGFTYLPYFLKRYCAYDNDSFKMIRSINSGDGGNHGGQEVESYRLFSDVDYDFYQDLCASEVTLTDTSAFKFIHIQGAHSPYRYNEDVEYISNATYETNIQACMTIANQYITMLKEAGVYDNTVIMFMSDHGYEAATRAGGTSQGVDRQNPVLFIKGFNEHHAMLRDDSPVSYADLQAAYVSLLDGAAGSDVAALFPDAVEGRERTHIVYAIRDKDNMFEYVTTGHASDTSSMVRTGKVYVSKEENGLSRVIGAPFKAAINWIYSLVGNMAWAIILFTLLTKIILLPVSIWVQFNSIKMVKMQPELNRINAKYYGDKEAIAEKQAELFKKEKYNPLVSIIPMAIQLILLMVVIAAIKGAMTGVVGVNTKLFEIDLRIVPKDWGNIAIFAPIVAALSAWVMCYTQNKSNVLQAEQGKLGQYGSMILSVALSLYLGWFVMIGVVVYWVASNLMSVAQMYILNYFINPKKYVDYAALEASKQELSSLKNVGGGDAKVLKKYAKREKEDYKRFFSIVNKKVVFYSENTGFYKYYKGMIEYLLEHTNLNIHYITSDPEDKIFELAKVQTKIKPYYIAEKKLITLFMKMDADVVVMTMPDIENYHIKRSYVRNDIKYIYVPHCIDSLNMTMRTGSMDHYDSVLCVGPHHREEIEKTEIAYNTTKKELVNWGYSLLDEMIADYESREIVATDTKTIMIAPSWQDDNIVDSCLEEILDELKADKFNVIVRPHPQHVRHRKEKMEQLKAKFASNDNITIQTDFSSNSDVFNADLLITDWSGIAYEYAYATKKPVLFVNTPMKIMNSEYQKIDTVPINILVREEIGCSVDTDKLDTIRAKVNELIDQSEEYHTKITKFTNDYVYNIGKSGEVGAKYIYSVIEQQVKKRKQAKK